MTSRLTVLRFKRALDMVLVLQISLAAVEKTLRDSFLAGIRLETCQRHGSNMKM